MNLYLTYRPNTLSEIVGNEEVVESLSNMMEKDPPHVIMLTGPTGCGKTTIGRIIASRLDCVGEDLSEINAADYRGIDEVRNIRKLARYSPTRGSARVFLIDECHKMTNDAQNALLKILEDTPKKVYFILCTTDPQKVITTIKGRCITFDVKTLSDLEMKILLKRVVQEEEEVLEKEVYSQIIQAANGHPRNALQILDQVLNVSTENRLETAKKAELLESASIDLCRALIKPNVGWKEVAGILEGLKREDPEGIRRHVLGYCQSVLLKKENDQAALVMECFLEPFYNTNFPGLVFASYSVVKGD